MGHKPSTLFLFGEKMQLTREFCFDAAHYLESYDPGHPNRRIHGHSFRVRVTLTGMPNDKTGQIVDLSEFGTILEHLREQLDHHMLNEIHGLETTTLENICLWLWEHLMPDLPDLSAVEVFRDSLGQSCLYQGSRHVK